MTIEEKLNEFFYVPEHLKCKEVDDEVQIQRKVFRAGANWMLEKAIDWLQYHVNDYLFDDGTPDRPWLKCKSEMFDDFKKAMKN